MLRHALIASLLLTGCAVEGSGDDDDNDVAGTDAAPGSADADPVAPDAAPVCNSLPPAAPAWLRSYTTDIVQTLSASPRSTSGQRAATRDYLDGRFTALGLTPQRHAYGTGTNVWARLAATQPSGETVVVGAHFDTVAGSPGANDNATGVAMVLALARYLQGVECRSKDVIFVLFDEEEVGLVGSFYFADKLVDDGTNVVAVHTIDQMGWDSNGDRLMELERPDTGLFSQYQQSNTAGGFGIPLVQTDTGSTDHVRFREAGFAAVGLTEGFASGDTTPHYHSPTDTFATVNLDYLESSSKLLLLNIGRFVVIEGGGTSPRVLPDGPPAFRPISPRARR